MAYVTSRDPGLRMQFLFYEDLPHTTYARPGTYIFAALESLLPGELRFATEFADQLLAQGDHSRVINHPGRVLGRLALLQKLFELGVNQFRATRASDRLDKLRYPVFVRREKDHNGSLTPLLKNWEELTRSLWYLRLQGHRTADLLVVEFCATSDAAGVYRKYSAFVVGDRILPRHILFGSNWLQKRPEPLSCKFSSEQQEFLTNNPHESKLRRIFSIANVCYGRIDYGLTAEGPQVWEINTHPTVRSLTGRLTAAFQAIDHDSNADSVPVSFSTDAHRQMQDEMRQRTRNEKRRHTLSALGSNLILLPLKDLIKRVLVGARLHNRAVVGRHSASPQRLIQSSPWKRLAASLVRGVWRRE